MELEIGNKVITNNMTNIINRYKISFDPNGGSGTMGTITCKKTLQLPLCTFKRQNHKFLGWSPDVPSNTPKFRDGQRITDIYRSAIFYAVWQPIVCTVSFNANGGSGTKMELQSCRNGATIKLRKNTYTRMHYTFAGWALSPTGEKKFVDAQSITVNSIFTLYAVWKPKTYIIQFNSNSGTGTMPDQKCTYGKTYTLNKNTFKRNGYVFKHWMTKDGKTIFQDTAPIKPINNVVLYAVWAKSIVVQPYTTAKPWNACTKSSNWSGKNAAQRMMNILSPHMSDATFKERVKWIKGRGCNCAHVFITNKADGEKAGYSPYGNKFDFVLDKNYCKVMGDRIKYLNKEGLGVILWLMADDSNAWAKTAQGNFAKYCADIKKLGWFDYASTVCLGLEIEEYWSSGGVVANLIAILRKYYSGKVATHHISNQYALSGASDLVFVQLAPGQSDATIKAFVQKVKKATGKPVNMFELERNADRHRSEVALKAGAYAVGNW